MYTKELLSPNNPTCTARAVYCMLPKVVDSGLDETSCFFADDDGLQVEHGFLFDGVRVEDDGNVSTVLGNYSFPFDMSRRKVGDGETQGDGGGSGAAERGAWAGSNTRVHFGTPADLWCVLMSCAATLRRV